MGIGSGESRQNGWLTGQVVTGVASGSLYPLQSVLVRLSAAKCRPQSDDEITEGEIICSVFFYFSNLFW